MRIAFLGGNGHSSSRLDRARRALQVAGDPFELVDLPYPGFEGRPRAPSFDAFVASVDEHLRERGADVGYATGIAALYALSLLASGRAPQVRWILQGPVLWGLERRWMPRILRGLGAAPVVQAAFGASVFQRRFLKKQLHAPMSADEQAAFFAGYASCSAFADFFSWLAPPLLRDLERSFSEDAAPLSRVEVWLGGHDHVVGAEDVRLTERALGVSLPMKAFPSWGHYPMIDDPEGWVREVAHAVA